MTVSGRFFQVSKSLVSDNRLAGRGRRRSRPAGQLVWQRWSSGWRFAPKKGQNAASRIIVRWSNRQSPTAVMNLVRINLCEALELDVSVMRLPGELRSPALILGPT